MRWVVAHRAILALVLVAALVAGGAALAQEKRIYVHLSTPSEEIAELLEPMEEEIMSELERTYAAGGYTVMFISDVRQRNPRHPLLLLTYVHEDEYGKYCDDSKASRGGCAHRSKGRAYVKVKQSDFRRSTQEWTKRRLIIVSVHEMGHLLGMKHPEHEVASKYPDIMSARANASLWRSPPKYVFSSGQDYVSRYGYSLPQEHFREADEHYLLRRIGVPAGPVRAAEYAITLQ